jgi:hypothetical protein
MILTVQEGIRLLLPLTDSLIRSEARGLHPLGALTCTHWSEMGSIESHP